MEKAVILNFPKNCVEIIDIPEKYIIYNIDGKMSGEEILVEMGYKMDNIQYMFVDGDVPVFHSKDGNGEHITWF